MPSIALAAPGYASADAKDLTKLDDDWSKVAATKDAEKTVAFYTDDAIVYPPNEPAAVGRAAAKKVWASYFALPDFAMTWKTTHAEASASGDLGYTTGTYEFSAKSPDGKPFTEKGKYACVWKKQKDGSWKSIHDMWNSDAK
jgi:ketosteroid isomerase-like protein